MVKPKSQQASRIESNINNETSIDALADRLADKPYGQPAQQPTQEHPTQDEVVENEVEEVERLTITVTKNIRYFLEDLALKRKRGKKKNSTISAIVREALEDYVNKKS